MRDLAWRHFMSPKCGKKIQTLRSNIYLRGVITHTHAITLWKVLDFWGKTRMVVIGYWSSMWFSMFLYLKQTK
jgi:hypothetical protein